MGKGFKTIIMAWLAMLSIVSLAAFCRSFHSDVKLGTDYLGILVGILAALCTVLIGWQIYTVIDFSQRERANTAKITGMTETLENLERKDLYRSYLSHYAIADIYAHICNGKVVDKTEYECVSNRLEALYYASVLEDWETCKLISSMVNRFIKRRGMKFNHAEIEEFKKTLLSTNGQNFSEEFCELLNTIQGFLRT